MPELDHWWQRAVIYQVYPRSFQDTSGDGVGDLAGIRSRLPHLESLGVDTVWLSPIYPSPMADFGYDVSDYTGIDPLFGTMADFDALVAAIHARGMRLVLDYVPNHSSDRHPWFLASRSSREDPKRDWYIWHDPAAAGGPPNNWLSHFGGSAWQWDAATGQYYLHSFLEAQPDLNWRNPQVKAAMFDVLRFWLARGVDGVSRRRPVASDQGRPFPRQSAEPQLETWRDVARQAPLGLRRRPARDPGHRGRDAHGSRQLRRPPADRRDLPAHRASGRLLRS